MTRFLLDSWSLSLSWSLVRSCLGLNMWRKSWPHRNKWWEKKINILITFLCNCGYSSMILLKLGNIGSFNVGSKHIYIYVYVLYSDFHWSVLHLDWMDLLPICDAVTPLIGHLESIGSLNFTDLLNLSTVHFKISKICLC